VKPLSLSINGRGVEAQVEPRLSLVDFLREHQFLTGTHVGCEHGVCGACTVLIDGAPARSCITFAVAADGAEVTTLEGFEHDPIMDILREAFSEHHGLQCGFCTPGMLLTAQELLATGGVPSREKIREHISGNYCRCTGYHAIVDTIEAVAQARNGAKP
jgi:aerobic carbon-monoxide dehydrogenase small subunit